jgi:glycerophosphoryl diester phosphodiesterase
MNLSSGYPFFFGEKPRIIGHRGAMGEAPENTFASFKKALDDGAPFLELDVHGSSDGEVVVIHDETLERTTNGVGLVRGFSLRELKALDAGHWFSPDGGKSYPYRDRRTEIPTLKEFFLEFPDARAIVELKQARPSVVERVIEVIRELGTEERVLLATEKDEIMTAIRQELPGRIATGFSSGEVTTFFRWAIGGRKVDYTPPGQALQIPRKFQEHTLVSRETVGAARDLGIELFVWTVNEVEEMKELLDLGVDGIITDYPARLNGLVSEKTA